MEDHAETPSVPCVPIPHYDTREQAVFLSIDLKGQFVTVLADIGGTQRLPSGVGSRDMKSIRLGKNKRPRSGLNALTR